MNGTEEREISLRSIIADALEDFENEKADILADAYPEDRIHEMADGAVPIYTSDVFQVAANSPEARYVDDEGLCDPSRGAEHVIQVAIYEQVSNALFEALRAAQEEAEEDDEDEE
jgi:hypothetical protein